MLREVRQHEGTFEQLRAAGAPAEGPAYADAGGWVGWAGLQKAFGTLRVQSSASPGHPRPPARPPADAAAAALMAVAPVGVARYSLEKLELRHGG